MTAFSVPVNLAFDNYTELTDAIADWMNRSDLSGSVQSMVALCEARLRRELQPLFGETTGSVAVVDGTGALPAGCDIIRHVAYDGAVIPCVSPYEGRLIAAGSTPTGYSIEGNSIYLWPSCDATVALTYQSKLVGLSEANPTNDMLSEHPDLYFYGSMLFAEGYVANDVRASLFKQLWDEAITETKRFLMRQIFGGPLVPRVQFVP